MVNIYNIIDNQIEFSKTCMPQLLDNYLKQWGKDAFLLLLNVDPLGKDSDDYITAFSKSNISFNFNDKRFYHYPVKVLLGYDEWAKITTGIDMTIFLMIPPQNLNNKMGTNPGIPYSHKPNITSPTVQVGDILSFIVQNNQYFYRVDQVPETYMGVLYRCSLKMATKKDLDNKADVTHQDNQPINVPTDNSWIKERIIDRDINEAPRIIPEDYGHKDPKYNNKVYVPESKPKPKPGVTTVDEFGNIVQMV